MKQQYFTFVVLFLSVLLCSPMAYAQEEEESEPFSALLGSYETRFLQYGPYYGRGRNIRRAADILGDRILEPNETYSFNGLVGRRTRRNGFRTAPVIANGRMSEGIGGGICQVASTLHAAALYAGLGIVEHHPHSRRSGYIGLGLDATVDYESKDLVLRNNFPFPVRIVLSHTEEMTVRVEIHGIARQYNIEVDVQSRVRRRPPAVFEVNEELQPGEMHLLDEGGRMIQVTRTRSFTPVNPEFPTWSIVEEINYIGAPRIVEIGPEEETE